MGEFHYDSVVGSRYRRLAEGGCNVCMSARQTDEIMGGDGCRENGWQFVEIQGRSLWATSEGIANE